MVKRIFQMFSVLSMAAIVALTPYEPKADINEEVVTKKVIIETITVEELRNARTPTEYAEAEPIVEEKLSLYSDEEIELIALVTMAEAETECEEGIRLVIDTILNRVESEYFPNTIIEVIYQENQYDCVINGRINRCYVRDDILKFINEEIENRTDGDVIFFRTKKYSRYGSPMYLVGSHYFSSYD